MSTANHLLGSVKTELNHLPNPYYRSTKYLATIIYYRVVGLACWLNCRKYTNEIIVIWETAHSLEACLDDLIRIQHNLEYFFFKLKHKVMQIC